MNFVQCRMARAALGWSLDDLAREAGVPVATLAQFERGDADLPRIEAPLRSVFELAGILFEADGQVVEGGPGVRLRRRSTDEGKRPDELSSANDG